MFPTASDSCCAALYMFCYLLCADCEGCILQQQYLSCLQQQWFDIFSGASPAYLIRSRSIISNWWFVYVALAVLLIMTAATTHADAAATVMPFMLCGIALKVVNIYGIKITQAFCILPRTIFTVFLGWKCSPSLAAAVEHCWTIAYQQQRQWCYKVTTSQ